jgi:hypothetical protein
MEDRGQRTEFLTTDYTDEHRWRLLLLQQIKMIELGANSWELRAV